MKKNTEKTSTFFISDLFKIIGIIVLIALIIVFFVLIFIEESKGFHYGEVDKINVLDSKEQVINILGKPTNDNYYYFEYYSKSYFEIKKNLKKIIGNDYKEDMSYQDALQLLDKNAKDYEEKINKIHSLTYDYIYIEFNKFDKVVDIVLDKNITIDRPKNYTKRVVSHQIVPGKIKPNEKTTLSFKVGYKDNSLHKFLLEENFEAKEDRKSVV